MFNAIGMPLALAWIGFVCWQHGEKHPEIFGVAGLALCAAAVWLALVLRGTK